MTTTDRKWNNFEPVAYLERQTPMACPVDSPSLKYNTHVVHCLIDIRIMSIGGKMVLTGLVYGPDICYGTRKLEKVV
jgi:hypothetical protein